MNRALHRTLTGDGWQRRCCCGLYGIPDQVDIIVGYDGVAHEVWRCSPARERIG